MLSKTKEKSVLPDVVDLPANYSIGKVREIQRRLAGVDVTLFLTSHDGQPALKVDPASAVSSIKSLIAA